MKTEKPIHSFDDLKKEESHNVLRLFDFLTYSLRKEIKKRPWEFLIIFFIFLVGTIVFSGVLITFITGGVSVKYTAPSFSLPNFSLPNILGAEITTSKSVINNLDPIVLVEKIRSGEQDYLLLDIRSIKDYESGHIKTASSLPVYGTTLVNNKSEVNYKEIKKLVKDKFGNKKEIIVYGHSSHSYVAYEVAQALGKNTKVLGIGWNEWAHFKNLWVPESEWNDLDISDYIQVKENE